MIFSSRTSFLPAWLRCLKIQMILLFASLLVISMSIFTLHVISEETAQRSDAMKLQAQVLAKNLAAAGAGYLIARDYSSIENMLFRAMEFSGIMSTQLADSSGRLIGDVVRDPQGKLITRYGQPILVLPHEPKPVLHMSRQYLVVWQPLELGEVLGWLRLTYSLQEIDQAADRIWSTNINTGILIAMVAIILVVLVLHHPIRTIQRYTEFSDSMDECCGKTVRVDHSARDLERLGIALNRTSLRLKDQSYRIQTSITELERLAAFAEHSPNLVLSVNETGDIQYINPRCQQLMSKLGLDMSVMPRILPANLEEIVAQVMDDGQILNDIERECCGRTYNWTFAPVSGQQLVHAYGVDITEKREAKRKANDAYAAKIGAEAANKTKSQFLASMSHELRTPLNAVIGYSEILSEDVAANGQQEYLPDLQKIGNSGKHLLSLINEILDLSKIEAGKMDLFLEEFSLQDLVDEVLGAVTPLSDKNGNSLHLECSIPDSNMMADSTKLRQILFNLLSNACKFTRSGSISLAIDSTTLLGEPAVDIRVKDTGIGMSKGQLEKVFEPFTQADKNTSANYGGTGLGLSITKRFCEMMGGDIQVISKLTQGTTFSIQLPLVVNGNAASEYYNNRSVNPAVVRFGNNRMERRKTLRKVLVIDSDSRTLELIELILHKEGFLVQKANNSAEGLRLALMSYPDVIMLDTGIPGMDVRDMIYELKTDPDLKQVPVVLMSDSSDKAMAKKLGASDSISKPIIRIELTELIKRWVRNRVKGQVLLVTDSAENLSSLKSMLGLLNLRVAVAADKKTALTICNHTIPELVLVDFTLPDNAGEEVIEALRKDSDHKNLSLVAVSTTSLSQQQQLLLGDAAFIQLKDSEKDTSELFERLERLLLKRPRSQTSGGRKAV